MDYINWANSLIQYKSQIVRKYIHKHKCCCVLRGRWFCAQFHRLPVDIIGIFSLIIQLEMGDDNNHMVQSLSLYRMAYGNFTLYTIELNCVATKWNVFINFYLLKMLKMKWFLPRIMRNTCHLVILISVYRFLVAFFLKAKQKKKYHRRKSAQFALVIANCHEMQFIFTAHKQWMFICNDILADFLVKRFLMRIHKMNLRIQIRILIRS